MDAREMKTTPAAKGLAKPTSVGLRSSIICLSATPPAEREVIVNRMIVLNTEVFNDQIPEKTREVFMGMHDDEVWVMTMEAKDQLVGFNFIRISQYQFKGKRIACMQSRAAILPTFRGKNSTGKFPAILYRKYKLRFPFVPVYGLIAMLHPSSFKLFAESMPRLHPYPRVELTAQEAERFSFLFQKTGIQSDPSGTSFVIRLRSSTKTSEMEEKYWQHSNHPSVRFFLAHCPEYQSGQGMMSFFKISFGLFMGIAWRKLGIPAKLHQLWLRLNPIAQQRANAAMLQQILQTYKLPESTLQKLAAHIRVLRIPTRHMLITQGQAQGAIYLLVQGSLFVHLHTASGKLTVDQLAPGAIVGEIGALLGVPATASVEAMGKCTVLQLGPETIQLLRAEAPAWMDHLLALVQSRLEMNRKISHGQ